ncbi:MAG: carboxypeptidase-like regulatory domain-containing protein [bacterium]|nr:carboxypeptidase-like regulatory domain-containing protein [bacterium]
MGERTTTIAAVRWLAVLGVLLLSACGHKPAALPLAQPTTAVARVHAARVAQPRAAAPSTGGWIMVCATNVAGAPLGPLQAWCKPADDQRGVLIAMPPPVRDAAQYTWPVPREGLYHFYFKASGHVQAREYDAVWLGQTTTLAAVFQPIGTNARVITGVVLDALTRQPLAGVALRDTSTKAFYAITEWTPRTDTAGTFRVLLGADKLSLRFTQAAYLAGTALLYPRQRTTNMVVCLSPPAQLRITALHADGAPVSNATAIVSGTPPTTEDMINGTAVFSNLPAGVALNYVLQHDDRTLIGGAIAALAPHSSTNVMVQLQRPGRLLLRFSELIPSNVFGESVCVACDLVTERQKGFPPLRPPGNFASRDFFAHNEMWVLAGLVPATYLVRIHGTNAVALATNVVVCSAGDTILDLCAGANSVGAIAGMVDDGTTTPKTFYVRALCNDVSHIVTTVDVDDTNVFCVAGLDLQRTYDLHVSVVSGLSITNLVVANVRPNSAPVRIVLERTYVVRGTVVDQHGAPVKLTTEHWGQPLLHAEQDGRFVYGPVSAGSCRISLRAEGFAPYLQEVMIEQADVDLGIIPMTRGDTISGRVIDEHGNPCTDASIVVVNMPCASFGDLINAAVASSEVDANGCFSASNVTPGVRCSVLAGRDDNQWAASPEVTPQADYNVGTICLRRPPWYEITFCAPDGSGLRDIEALGLKQNKDNPDIWQGSEPPTIVLFNAVLLMPTSPTLPFGRHVAFLNAAFVPCPTGYAPTNRMAITVPAQWYRQYKDPR